MTRHSRPHSWRRGTFFAPLSALLVAVVLLAASAPAAAAGPLRAYLANQSVDSLIVIDDATGVVLASVPMGARVRDVAFAPDGSRVYVSHGGGVSVVDGATLAVVDTIPFVGSSFGLDATPGGNRLYVALLGSDTVAVVDTATLSVIAEVPVGNNPTALVATADGQHVYVANSDNLSVIDTASNTVVATTPVANSPRKMALSPDGTRLFVTHMYGAVISVLDTATHAVVDVFAMGTETNGIAVSPDGLLLYMTARGDDELLVLDATSGAIVGRFATGNGPQSVDVTPDGTKIYVASGGDDFVSVVDAASLLQVDAITVPSGTTGGLGRFLSTFDPAPPEGVDLSDPTSGPLTYAAEIVASPASPVALDNSAGQLNLTAALGYSFSPDETRYVRFACPGVVFPVDAEAVYVGDGSASVGALNGLNSGAIHFSITAHDANVHGDDLLTITGGRAITGTEPVDCSYGVYDFPSQAATGAIAGRVAGAGGAYLDFAPGTAFAASPLVAVADVEAEPAFAAFAPAGATTGAAGALATLEYGPATDVPLEPDGTPVMLSDLHATGPDGTRIVVTGDFGAAANADGSFTGATLDRVYLSASNVQCIPGVAPDTVDAERATFIVGATPLHRLLCYAPLSGIPIPVADYAAELVAVAATAAYEPRDIGPLDAGTIERNGTHLQAPLAQVPGGWYSRLALTNTGARDRPYVIAVSGESGNAIGTANLEGLVPANGTIVVDLRDVLVSFGAERRATLNVTIAGPDRQLQGLYQIINPDTGMLSNQVMVRPGTN